MTTPPLAIAGSLKGRKEGKGTFSLTSHLTYGGSELGGWLSKEGGIPREQLRFPEKRATAT